MPDARCQMPANVADWWSIAAGTGTCADIGLSTGTGTRTGGTAIDTEPNIRDATEMQQ